MTIFSYKITSAIKRKHKHELENRTTYNKLNKENNNKKRKEKKKFFSPAHLVAGRLELELSYRSKGNPFSDPIFFTEIRIFKFYFTVDNILLLASNYLSPRYLQCICYYNLIIYLITAIATSFFFFFLLVFFFLC